MNYSVDPYLAHFGVLGMEWGVRRYQNKDGSLTELGRERYGVARKKVLDKNEGKEIRVGHSSNEKYEEEKKIAGVESIDEDTDIIKAGATFQRIAMHGEPVDEKRKYVSLLRSDKRLYEDNYNGLPMENTDLAANITLESKKPIKVATLSKTKEELEKFNGENKVERYDNDLFLMYGKKKTKKLLNMYGDKKLSDLVYDPGTLNELMYNENKTFKLTERAGNLWMVDYLKAQQRIVDLANDKVTSGDDAKSYEFYNHMKKLGYDAFVDPFDASDGFTDYPLVLLSPSESVKKTKEEYMFDAIKQYYDDDD